MHIQLKLPFHTKLSNMCNKYSQYAQILPNGNRRYTFCIVLQWEIACYKICILHLLTPLYRTSACTLFFLPLLGPQV